MMNLNATLLGEILIFCVFIWFVMKFVWPPLVTMMEERKQAIADGLAAAEKWYRDAELAEIKLKKLLMKQKPKLQKFRASRTTRACGDRSITSQSS